MVDFRQKGNYGFRRGCQDGPSVHRWMEIPQGHLDIVEDHLGGSDEERGEIEPRSGSVNCE